MSTMIHTSTGYVFDGLREHMTGREKRILTAAATYDNPSAIEISTLTGIAETTVHFILLLLWNIGEVEPDTDEPSDLATGWNITDRGIHALHEAHQLSLDEMPPYCPEADDK